MQPRQFRINSIVADTQERLKWVKANFVGIDVSLRIDNETYDHLTGKPLDKTAGRNTLGLRNGK
jgi:hypothetical protein